MSALDVIPVPGHLGMYARRAFVDAWQAAGSPRINSAGRLYQTQKLLFDGWRKGLPGFNPADNPDDESQRLAHVRFVAGDIDPTPERVRRLSAAGLIRPYSYEPWHWELPNVRQYAIVRSIPTGGGTAAPTPERRLEMRTCKIVTPRGTMYALLGTRYFQVITEAQANRLKKLWGEPANLTYDEWDEAWNLSGATGPAPRP